MDFVVLMVALALVKLMVAIEKHILGFGSIPTRLGNDDKEISRHDKSIITHLVKLAPGYDSYLHSFDQYLAINHVQLVGQPVTFLAYW